MKLHLQVYTGFFRVRVRKASKKRSATENKSFFFVKIEDSENKERNPRRRDKTISNPSFSWNYLNSNRRCNKIAVKN